MATLERDPAPAVVYAMWAAVVAAPRLFMVGCMAATMVRPGLASTSSFQGLPAAGQRPSSRARPEAAQDISDAQWSSRPRKTRPVLVLLTDPDFDTVLVT